MGGREPSLKLSVQGRPRELMARSPCSLIVMALCLCLTGAAAPRPAASSEPAPAPTEVQQLMRNVAWNELQARKHPGHYYEYHFSEETPQGSQTFLQIETGQGMVERLMEVNGRPPSERQCHKSLDSLRRVASQPQLQQSQLRSQQEDLARRAQLFAAMPDAFIFRAEGVEKGTGWLRIAYSPNPQFRPRGRVGGVLVGLQGTLWVDRSAQRLVRIQGRLVRDVTFGWGFLARLDRGGEFVLIQSRLPDGAWHEKVLRVNFQGSILLVKKLDVDMKDTFYGFKDVPDRLTLLEAIHTLESAPVKCGSD